MVERTNFTPGSDLHRSGLIRISATVDLGTVASVRDFSVDLRRQPKADHRAESALIQYVCLFLQYHKT